MTTLDKAQALTSQTFTDPNGRQKQTPWFADQEALVDYIGSTGGTINATYQRQGGEMWEVVAGEKLPL